MLQPEHLSFRLSKTVSDSLMEFALNDSIVPAKHALRHLDRVKTDEEVVSFWKRVTRTVASKPNGYFIHYEYKGKSNGFGFAEFKGDVFYAYGGFFGPINGSRKYGIQKEWWNAIADFAKSEGFSELRFDVRKGSTLLSACEIVAPKLKYPCEIDKADRRADSTYTCFRIYLD